MDSPHKKWCPRFDTKKKAPVPVVAPPSWFQKFMAKAQRSIFNMCKFHAQEVVTNNKFAHARAKKYKDRLRALRDSFPMRITMRMRTTTPAPCDLLGWSLASFPFLVLVAKGEK
jgi:hypothetical protein